jgi:hypothetical protein
VQILDKYVLTKNKESISTKSMMGKANKRKSEKSHKLKRAKAWQDLNFTQ